DPERVHGATAIVCDGPAAHFREIEIFPLGARLLLLDGAAEMAPPGRTPGNGSFSDPKIVKVLGFAFGQVPGAAADLPIRSNSEDMPTVLVDVEPMPAVRRQFAALNGPVPEIHHPSKPLELTQQFVVPPAGGTDVPKLEGARIRHACRCQGNQLRRPFGRLDH